MLVNETTVKIHNVILAWDGIAKPDKRDDGQLSYNLAFCVNPQAPEIGELDHIANQALANSEFNGVMPQGGNWPLGKWADAAKLGQIVNGMMNIKASSKRIPSCYMNGQKLDQMQFGGMLYPGVILNVLVHAAPYKHFGGGITFMLDGFEIVDMNAPKLDVVAGMNENEIAGALGGNAAGGGQQGGAPNQGGYQAPANQGQGGQPYQQNPQGGGQQYQNPNQQGGAPNQGQNYQNPNQGGGNPGYNPQGGGAPNQNQGGGQNNGTPVQTPGYMNQ